METNLQNRVVAALLSDRDESKQSASFQGLNDFDKAYHDFFALANKDSSVPNEAQLTQIMQEIKKELEAIASCPQLYTKNVIAVGGGFSAGKSAFINSLITAKDTKLPTGVAPTTAIPTYVLSGKQKALYAFSHENISVNLNEIDEKIHSKISHEFIESFGFRLKKIMPFMILETEFNEAHENLCFIDTPGYNAGSNELTKDDRQSASEFLSNASALLWLIESSAGTISGTDLEFIKDANLGTSKLYVVISKADKQMLENLKDIMSHIAGVLKENGVKFEGISAYSAAKKQELAFEKKSLSDFLTTKFTQKMQDELLNKLFRVYSAYRTGMLTKSLRNKAILDALNSLRIDLIEAGADDDISSYKDRLDRIENVFKKSDDTHEHLGELDEIFIALTNAVNKVFGKRSKKSLPKIEEADIKEKIKKDLDLDLDDSEALDEALKNMFNDSVGFFPSLFGLAAKSSKRIKSPMEAVVESAKQALENYEISKEDKKQLNFYGINNKFFDGEYGEIQKNTPCKSAEEFISKLKRKGIFMGKDQQVALAIKKMAQEWWEKHHKKVILNNKKWQK